MIYYVYAIEDYAGMSRSLKLRMKKHRAVGRNTERLQLLKSFNNKEDARIYERHLHINCGYLGKQIPHKQSQETRDKISASQKGRKLPKEHVEKIREGNKGVKRSAETKNRIAVAMTGNKNAKKYVE